MVEETEGWFALKDGTKLYTKTWSPSSTPVAHLIALHGFSDHINAYYNLFPTLAGQYSIKVHGFDQRGWGRSAPEHAQWGRTGDTVEVVDDIAQFVQHVASTISSSTSSESERAAPLFLFGHSMGGGEALTYLLNLAHGHPQPNNKLPNFAGLVLESPYVALPPSSAPSPLLVFSGRIAAKILPNHQMKQKLDPSFMCHDPKVCEDWEHDPLCHDTGTLRGLAGLLERAAVLDDLGKDGGKIKGRKVGPPCPTFWAHGDGDKVCSFEESKRLYGALYGGGDGRSEFKDYKGAYHKLHAEPEGVGEQFAKDVGGWIVRIAGGDGVKAEARIDGANDAAVEGGKGLEGAGAGAGAVEYKEAERSRL